jgi:amino acid adenylation domain-containing protein
MSAIQDHLANLSEEQRALLLKKLMEKRATSARVEQERIHRRSGHGPWPLSFAQELMWLLDRLNTTNIAYNTQTSRWVYGPLNVEALQKTMDALVARHEILRTTYTTLDGKPVQVVHENMPSVFEFIDIRHLPEHEREEEAHRLFAERVEYPFDLTRDVMLRTTVVQLDSEKYALLQVIHHIATDGWSKGKLNQEMEVLYRHYAYGEPVALPEPALHYADYAIWQREWLQGKVLERLLGYWKKQLQGAPALLELPTDHPRPPVQTGRGAKCFYTLPKSLILKAREFSRQEGATLFMTMLAAFNILMSRYSGQEDIVVGTPIANRNRIEWENIQGFFTNTLALRTQLGDNPSFRELVRRVRETVLGAFDHQEMPFEKLIIELKPPRDLSYTPIFQVMFALQEEATTNFLLPGVELRRMPIRRTSAKFDLLLSLVDADEPRGSCEYSTDLFEQATIERMLGHFRRVLEGALVYPDGPISKIDILTPAERRQLLVDWNQTHRHYPKGRTITQLFEAQVEQTPNAIAVTWEGHSLSYHELNALANRVAHFLQRRGVGPDTLVGICVERSLEMVIGVLGVLKAGGAYVPLDPSYPVERLACMMEDAQTRLILTLQQLCHRLPKHTGELVFLDGDLTQREKTTNPHNMAGPNSLAYVIYTSGSTGKPKGVMITHSNLVNAYYAWEEAYALREPNSVHLQMASFSFDVCTGDIVRALCSGGKLVLCPLETLLTPEKLYALMRAEKVNCAEFVPAVLRSLVQYLRESGQSLDFMRLLICGSDTWYVGEYTDILRLCGPKTRLINSYGLAEATIDSTYFENTYLDLPAEGVVPIGRPFANTELYILDPQMQPVPVGVPGELYVGGAGLARGYWDRPDLTAERFVPHPFNEEPGARLYKTGDRVRYLPDGTVEFLGRTDHQIKIRGFRIEPGEIETVLTQHPDVRQAVVVAREDEPGEKRLVAYVVPTELASPNAQVLRDFLKSQLPAYMIPSAFVSITELPLSPNGKVDASRLPRPENCTSEEEEFIAPRTPVEEMIAEMWAEVLRVERVGVFDDFFALGGHSLLATQIIARIRDAFDVNISMRTLFENPTIAGLAVIVVQQLVEKNGGVQMVDIPSAVEFA